MIGLLSWLVTALLSGLVPGALAQAPLESVPATAAPSPPAPSEATPSTNVTLRVAIDDRTAKRIGEATLKVEGGLTVTFDDNGGSQGDVPGDGVYLATASVPRRTSWVVHVINGGVDLGKFELRSSASTKADLALKSRAGSPALVVDLNAPPIVDAPPIPVVTSAPPAPADATTAPSTLVAQAAPSPLPGAPPSAPDRMRLILYVDDRDASRLHEGRLVVQQEGIPPAPLVDDGVAPDVAAADRIYTVTLEVSRAQFVKVALMDEPAGHVGELTVFLPSASEALVRLHTLAAAPGLELAQEPAPGTAADAPTAGAASVSTSGSVSRDRLSQILWVFVCVFAVAFAWVRTVVARRWTGEVQPLLGRLERWLDAQEAASRGGRPPGGDQPGGPGVT